MSTLNRLVHTEHDRTMAARVVENRPIPFTLTITDGAKRSKAQNRLMNMWYAEIAEQKGDSTAQEVRAYCKLTIGVPILRAQNEAFRIRYDEILRPMRYDQKIAIMSEPLNLPVTSLMNTKQLTEYLEAIMRHFGEQGIVLTMPEDLRNQIYSSSDASPTSEPDGPVSSEEAGDTPPSSSASPLSKADRQKLMKYARSIAKTMSNEDIHHEAKKQIIENGEAEWREVTDRSLWGKMSALKLSAITSIQNPKRYTAFACEMLECSVADLEVSRG